MAISSLTHPNPPPNGGDDNNRPNQPAPPNLGSSDSVTTAANTSANPQSQNQSDATRMAEAAAIAAVGTEAVTAPMPVTSADDEKKGKSGKRDGRNANVVGGASNASTSDDTSSAPRTTSQSMANSVNSNNPALNNPTIGGAPYMPNQATVLATAGSVANGASVTNPKVGGAPFVSGAKKPSTSPKPTSQSTDSSYQPRRSSTSTQGTTSNSNRAAGADNADLLRSGSSSLSNASYTPTQQNDAAQTQASTGASQSVTTGNQATINPNGGSAAQQQQTNNTARPAPNTDRSQPQGQAGSSLNTNTAYAPQAAASTGASQSVTTGGQVANNPSGQQQNPSANRLTPAINASRPSVDQGQPKPSVATNAPNQPTQRPVANTNRATAPIGTPRSSTGTSQSQATNPSVGQKTGQPNNSYVPKQQQANNSLRPASSVNSTAPLSTPSEAYSPRSGAGAQQTARPSVIPVASSSQSVQGDQRVASSAYARSAQQRPVPSSNTALSSQNQPLQQAVFKPASGSVNTSNSSTPQARPSTNMGSMQFAPTTRPTASPSGAQNTSTASRSAPPTNLNNTRSPEQVAKLKASAARNQDAVKANPSASKLGMPLAPNPNPPVKDTSVTTSGTTINNSVQQQQRARPNVLDNFKGLDSDDDNSSIISNTASPQPSSPPPTKE